MKLQVLHGAFLAALLVVGCGGQTEQQADTETTGGTEETQAEAPSALRAVALLEPTEGNDVHGRVEFEVVDGGVRVHAEVEGLTPGLHGFHVHEKGDCSAPDAGSAGGHFAPHGNPHGAPDDLPTERHVGDLGNLNADSTGVARYDRIDMVISLEGENSIVDKAVIVHSGEDDLESQPTGDAGARVACGVIRTEATSEGAY
ncbi:MAG: superoxide dismutase family protein [Candidatus Eisenbacteria bacterium]|nr:superoxide dismutase family protein [Candidatus Latescibacterota bacterium]MBD3303050.1 superoxide dismutase family protein [Candidatus Eisenbacteria bacterium]